MHVCMHPRSSVALFSYPLQPQPSSIASYVDRALPSERDKDPTDCLAPLLPLVRACVRVVGGWMDGWMDGWVWAWFHCGGC